MRERVLGTLTIGQAPRPDVVPIIDRYVSADIRRIHRGVLDGLSHTEIAARYRPEGGEPELVTRLQDRTAVVLSRHRMKDGVQQALTAHERHAPAPLGVPAILSYAFAANGLSELTGGYERGLPPSCVMPGLGRGIHEFSAWMGAPSPAMTC